MPILLKLFQNTEEEEKLLGLFFKTRNILVPKPDKKDQDTTRTEIQNPQQNISKPNSAIHQKDTP